MKLISAALTFLVLAVLLTAPVHAQATRTWVSGVGDDANPCSRTAPCKTFAGAISKTAPSGEISVLDPGGFGAVTITKSITLDGDGTLASILVSGTAGIIVNPGAGGRVIIRNISFQGLGTGTNAISILSGSNVTVDHVNINGFTTAGINMSVGAAANLVVTDTNITNCATGVFLTTSSALAQAMLDNVRLTGNTNGIEASTNGRVTITRSVISGNSNHGLLASLTNPRINVNSSQLSFNGGTAVNCNSATGIIRISNNEINNNNVGIGIGAVGCSVESTADNRLAGNVTPGASNAVEAKN
jgi:hypothetical protein